MEILEYELMYRYGGKVGPSPGTPWTGSLGLGLLDPRDPPETP